MESDRFRVDPEMFEIFSKQTELKLRHGKQVREKLGIDDTVMRYVSDTARLIARIDGSAVDEDGNPLVKPDHVVYLDKSARPVSWFVNIFWEDFAVRDENGKVARRPPHSYLNIDRKDWIEASGTTFSGGGDYILNPDGSTRRYTERDFHIDGLPSDTFARIRSLYIPGGIEDEDVDKIMNTPVELDGKDILIIDEVANTGATQEIAKQILERTFHGCRGHVDRYWDAGMVSLVGGDAQMASAPVWYDANHYENRSGRGIGDRNPHYFEQRYQKFPNNKTRAQRYGSNVLSAFMDLGREDGRLSRRLMDEIKRMHSEYQAGHILFRPPNYYDFDRFEAAVQAQGLYLQPEEGRQNQDGIYIKVVQEIQNRKPSEDI